MSRSHPRRRLGRFGQPVVELALALKHGKLVIAADMAPVDEDLRHGAQALGAIDHLGALVAIESDVDLLELERFLGEKPLGRAAIAAEGRGVEHDTRHA